MSNDPAEESKLIIDEDYKSQVQREKEEAAAKQKAALDKEAAAKEAEHSSAAPAEETVEQGAATDAVEQTSAENAPPPPPASLTFLVTSLATQAMAAMGQLPNDDGDSPPVNLAYARHFIDLIGIVEEKTKGNLDETEDSFVQDTLHQMRMLFVAASQKS